MWWHVTTLFAHHPGPYCVLRWGWWHQPPCCYDVNNASGDGRCGDRQRAGGGGEQKGSVDDCCKDNNNRDELDSGGGNAAGGKEGTPLKHKG